jgi:hypothetical protein
VTSFLLRAKARGAHVHVAMFAGPDAEHRANCGVVVMRPGEWTDFRRVLEEGPARADVEFTGVAT